MQCQAQSPNGAVRKAVLYLKRTAEKMSLRAGLPRFLGVIRVFQSKFQHGLPSLYCTFGFLTSRRGVETVELSFVHQSALKLHLRLGGRVAGERLVCGRCGLDEGSEHGGFPDAS